MKIHLLCSSAILVMWGCSEANFGDESGGSTRKLSSGSTSKCKPTLEKPCSGSQPLTTSQAGSGPGTIVSKKDLETTVGKTDIETPVVVVSTIPAPAATKDLDTTVGGQAFTTPTAPCQIWRCKNTVAVKEVFYPTYHEPGCPGTATIDSSTIPHGTSMFKITHKVGHIGYFYAFDPSNEQVNGYDNDALTAPRVTCNNGTMP